MYTPAINQETDLPTLQHFLRDNPLCALVTPTRHGIVASHIPMVLHEVDAGIGTLRGHLARANMQWRDALLTEDALAIFTGPQHYISASWYPGKQLHGREVPTWNYVAVHAYGPLRLIDDTAWLLEHLRELADRNEGIAEIPWRLDDAPADFISKLSRAIVGIELPIARIEGKWKASQNRTEEDAAGVVDGLNHVATPASAAMKALVQSRRPR